MANTVFENVIIEAKAKDLLTTSINTRSLMTIDSTLAETAGMKKTENGNSFTIFKTLVIKSSLEYS